MPKPRSTDTGHLTTPLRVLMVTTSFPINSGDVSGIFVSRLADALSERVALEVLTPCGSGAFAPDASYPVHCFRYAPRTWQALTHSPGGIPAAIKRQPAYTLLLPVMLSITFLAVFRRARQVDVIHANWSLTGLICGLAGRLRGCPVITTLRGSDVSRLENSRLIRLLTAWTLKLSHHTVTVSSTMKDEIRTLFPKLASCLSHIPNGVDDSLFALPMPKGNDTLKITTVGNLIPGKAIHELLHAVASYDGPLGMRTTIVGDGPERERLETLAQSLGLAGKVQFTGTLPPQAVAAVLGETDIFVLTSHSEGRPNVVVEAMAAGRAVVATALPGVRELLEHESNGLLFNPGDTVALTDHLRHLANDPALRLHLGDAARQTVVELGLTWQSCAKNYHALYRQNGGSNPACAD